MREPEVARSSGELAAFLGPRREGGARVGLVPTMGALHEGHLSLIRRAAAENDLAVATIFVNPKQFAPGEDLDRYPRAEKRDRELAGEAGAELLFVPDAGEIYPAGFRTHVEVEGLSDVLCGARRPGHFRGVATVVWKLLQLVDPAAAYFGAKDAQQLVVIRRMVRDLAGPWRIVAVPTVREEDGLALSSRNRYLVGDDRRHAAALHRALRAAREALARGERSAAAVIGAVRAVLDGEEGVAPEYVACVSPDDLEPVDPVAGRVLVAIAAEVGAARLIDNICLRVENDTIEETLP